MNPQTGVYVSGLPGRKPKPRVDTPEPKRTPRHKDSPAADATAAERKAKALARQKAAMAQMAARQAAFALAATDDDDVESDFDGDANVAGSNPDMTPIGSRGTRRASAGSAAGPRRIRTRRRTVW